MTTTQASLLEGEQPRGREFRYHSMVSQSPAMKQSPARHVNEVSTASHRQLHVCSHMRLTGYYSADPSPFFNLQSCKLINSCLSH